MLEKRLTMPLGPGRALYSALNKGREVGASQLPCHIGVLLGVPKGIRTPVAGVKGISHTFAGLL